MEIGLGKTGIIRFTERRKYASLHRSFARVSVLSYPHLTPKPTPVSLLASQAADRETVTLGVVVPVHTIEKVLSHINLCPNPIPFINMIITGILEGSVFGIMKWIFAASNNQKSKNHR